MSQEYVTLESLKPKHEQPAAFYKDVAIGLADQCLFRKSNESHFRLGRLGLNENEIGVLSRLNDGNSPRETAELCGLSGESRVRYIRDLALAKLHAKGHYLKILDNRTGRPTPRQLQRYDSTWNRVDSRGDRFSDANWNRLVK